MTRRPSLPKPALSLGSLLACVTLLEGGLRLALIAGSQLCIVPNSDHFVANNKPGLFTTLILEFLAGR